MRKTVLAFSAIVAFLVIDACKKSDSVSSNARTMQNLSGSYTLVALTANILGVSVKLYDSLPPCEKDNLIQLNANGNAQFIDANIKCVPPSDSTGTWSLSSNTDTIYVAGNASFINSWDGKTLVLNNSEKFNRLPVVATTTLVKQ